MRALLPLAALGVCWGASGALPEPVTNGEMRLALYGSGSVVFVLLALVVALLLPLTRLASRRLLALAAGALVVAIVVTVLNVAGAADAAKIVLGAIVGMLLVRLVERPWWLLPLCVVVTASDAWSVLGERGVTKAVVARSVEQPEWITWPTIAIPVAGYSYAASPRIGIVDVIFLALFLAAAHRWHMGMRRGIVLLPLSFVATNALIFEAYEGEALPALPLLTLAFLVAYAAPLARDARADRRGEAATR